MAIATTESVSLVNRGDGLCSNLADVQQINVMHAIPVWLSVTEYWLYVLIASLPKHVDNSVVCMRTANLDKFPISGRHVLIDDSRLKYYWEHGRFLASMSDHRPYFARTAAMESPDIVHSHFGSTGWEMTRGTSRFAAKHVVSFYGFDVTYLPRHDPVWRERYRQLFRSVDSVLCEGPHMARRVAHLGDHPEKVHVHRLGVPVHNIDFAPRTLERGEPLRILIASSFQQKKGIPDAVEAIGRAMRHIPIEVTIIGDANPRQARSRREKTRILEAVKTWGLEDKIRLLGYQHHDVLMQEAYDHHVYLAASRVADDGDTEGGLPYTIPELVASGMPIISTRHCDIPEIVHHGTTGLLADERDPKDLASQICWLADHIDSWPAMIDAGRALVEMEFNAITQGARLADYYASLLN